MRLNRLALLAVFGATLVACEGAGSGGGPTEPSPTPKSTPAAEIVVPSRVEKSLSEEIRKTLEGAESLTLFSLYPAGRSTKGFDPVDWNRYGLERKETLHDYPILGSVELKGAERVQALNAVYKGIGDSDGKVAACFNPRHGLRAVLGQTQVDLVICYECLSMSIYVNDVFWTPSRHTPPFTTEAPGRELNRLLKLHGVELPSR